MTEKMCIILDLDSSVISSLHPWEKTPNNLTGYNMDDEYIVYERPHLQEFLGYLFANFNVGVWTAASKDYALFIVSNILIGDHPERKLKFVMFDYHCDISSKNSKCCKDLHLVWKTFPEFTRNNTIIIDDYENVFASQMSNSYPIPAFEADSPNAYKDTELIKLQNKLTLVKSGEIPNEHLITEQTLAKAVKKIRDAQIDD